MAVQNFGLDAAAWEPQSNGVVVGSTGDNVSVGREGDSRYLFGVSVKGEVSLGVGHVPERQVAIDTRGDDVFAA